MPPVLFSWGQKKGTVTRNPHFWALIALIIFLVLLYYSWFLPDFRSKYLWELVVFEFQHQCHGILFSLPIAYTAAIFWWRGTVIMWLIAVALTLPLTFYFKLYPISVLANIFYLSIPVLIVGYISLEINWRNRERKSLLEREEERKAYITQIFQAQEEERKRIAQELHDDTIHSLLVIASKAENMSSDRETKTIEQLKAESETVRGEILHVSDELRRLTLDLRPGILDNIGFIPALRWLVDRLSQEEKIDAKMVVIGQERRIPNKKDVMMFRIVQEALNNIRLHAMASVVMVTLEFGIEKITISIHDNGKGFTLPKRINYFTSKGKLGLMGIQERARSINGTFDIKSKPGQGTIISIEVCDKL